MVAVLKVLKLSISFVDDFIDSSESLDEKYE